jgi:hypothetical protein
MQDRGYELLRIPLLGTLVNNDAHASIVGDANSVERGHLERGHQVMADDGSQQRKPDIRTAVEDV